MKMKNKGNAVIITLGILILGTAVEFLFELMPDKFKLILTDFSSNYLGLSYSVFWLLSSGILILCTFYLVWRQKWADQNNSDHDTKPAIVSNVKRKVTQKGDKSVYIENSKGDINIE